ncbi:L,D-transpeptidase [Bifidobacterium amazonense]|uniref:L,D-transpeptidase n=1 Tax=Bifidobacterium amazonense TaxID=2809027 RepID=A0ABS9VTL2_9BIFI|nr:L,D-transpeptidase [Bifidobacterium amazonense]MCH9275444.1 L,D-transpeptidase [Bifidobacterium amazonense]
MNTHVISDSMRKACAAGVAAAAVFGLSVIAAPTASAAADPSFGQGGRYYYFLNGLHGGKADRETIYGKASDTVLVGDWNGDGKDTLAVRRGNQYHIKNAIAGGAADQVVTYGHADDTVLVGDWNGDGKDTLAVRRGNTYYIKNTLGGGPADAVITYGRADDTVLVGDWNGDGKDTLAVQRGNTYYISDSITSGPADSVVTYGRADDAVLVGDWNGDGKDTFAVRRGSTFYVKNAIAGGAADETFTFGRETDGVLVGDWDGNGTDTLAVRRDNDAPKTPQYLRPSGGAYPNLGKVANLSIEVSLAAQRVYVKSGSTTIYTMLASTGMDDSTPHGTYYVQNRGGSFYNSTEGMGANYWVSWKDYGTYLFHTVPTDRNGNYIVSEANKLGRPASHGCVRLTVPDAKWLYDQLPEGTKVVIH